MRIETIEREGKKTFVLQSSTRVLHMELREAVAGCTKQENVEKIILSMENIVHIEKRDLAEIIRALAYCGRKGVGFSMINLRKEVKDFMTLADLLTVVPTFETKEEALKAPIV